MKKVFLFLSLFFFVFPLYAANTNLTPVGYWKTIDDVTGKPKAILHIFQTGNTLYGRIMKTWPRPGYDQNEVCTACTGSRHNQRIVGMVIMEGLRQDSDNPHEWSGGKILDPMTGKSYNCSMTVVNQGKYLNVRGYIGLSMFGRTQTWVRVSGK